MKDFISGLKARRWQIWMAMAVATISFMLSSCSGAADYKTDLGDPSHYKELYTKAIQDNKALERELSNTLKDNTKLRERYAALKAQKSSDLVLLEREKAVDERERVVSEREEQAKRDRAEIDNTRSRVFDSSVEFGETIGQLESAKVRISELSKELTDIKNQQKGSARFSSVKDIAFVMIMLGLLAYIFLDKYGILRRRSDEMLSSNQERSIKEAVVVSDISSKDESATAGALEQVKNANTRALPPEQHK